METLVGKTLDHYQILEKIASGGMATVYRAADARSGQIVAVKVMHAHLAEDPVFIQRFRREARTAMSLDSPHIVRVLNYGEDGGMHFLVMEYVQGKTLSQLIRESGRLPISLALEIARQLAQALHVAQRHGIVHRDLKPQNLMITPEGIVKVMDFGVAREAGAVTLTQTGIIMGTPYYMSPEQAGGKRPDVRSDIYAWGIILYEMLTGCVPFTGESPLSILMQHQRSVPPQISRLRGDTPPQVEALVMKAMAKDIAQRFQTPADILAALQRMDADTISVQRGAPRKPMPRAIPRAFTGSTWMRKRYWAMVGIGGLVVLIGIVFSVSLPTMSPTHSSNPSATPAAAGPPQPTETEIPLVVIRASPSVVKPTAVLSTPLLPMLAPSATPVVQKRLDPIVGANLPNTYVGDTRVQSLVITDLASNTQSPFFTRTCGRLVSAAWSPGGNEILVAYTWYCDEQDYGSSTDILTDKPRSKATIMEIKQMIPWYTPPNKTTSRPTTDYYHDAIWSPNGHRVVLNHTESPMASPKSGGNRCPAIFNKDGTGYRKLVNCEADDYPRYWSVDGKWIITWSERDLSLWAYEVDGSRRLPLSELGRIQMYDQRYYPWRIIDQPNCKGDLGFWSCE